MKRMSRPWVGVAASVAVIAAVAGVTLGITTLLGVTFEESDPKPAEGLQTENAQTNQPDAGQGSPIARYPGFSFCIEAIGVDPTIEALGKTRTETALLEVMQHPYWNLLRPGSPPPLVDIGCPSDPLIARPGVDWDGPNFYARGDLDQYNVSEPSFYWTFIFIMPVDQINQLLGGASLRVAPQEYVWDGAVVRSETTAIFFSPEELQDPSFLVKQLTFAVGLEDPFPETPDTGQR